MVGDWHCDNFARDYGIKNYFYSFIISYADCILNIDQSVEVSKTYITVFWVHSLGSDDTKKKA